MSNDTDEYLVEFVQVGTSVKVSAIDVVTGREVSIVGPVSSSRHHLSQVAVRKLKYVLAKERP